MLDTKRSLICCTLIVLASAFTAPTMADDGAAAPSPLGSAVPAEEPLVSKNLRLAELAPFSVAATTAEIVFTEQGCTVTDTCVGYGTTIQCSGTTCSTASKYCSHGGSTCPLQGGTVKAVKCDGVIRDSCPCPEVCYGCGSYCTTEQDCESVCNCGAGACMNNQCECAY